LAKSSHGLVRGSAATTYCGGSGNSGIAAALIYQRTEKCIVKTPKLHFLEPGLLASARSLTFNRVKVDRGTFGALLESFVFSEVPELVTASDLRLTAHHFRDRDMREVGSVLERGDGMIAGIEVKASATVESGDFAGLRALADPC
jgi:predicted AAA+ superfamily ATPase